LPTALDELIRMLPLQIKEPQLRVVPKNEGCAADMPGRRLSEGQSPGAGAWSLHAAGSTINGVFCHENFKFLKQFR